MTFQVEDRVVHPVHGIGQVVGVVSRQFTGAEAKMYYEVALTRSTVWIPVEAGAAGELRPLTAQRELQRYRDVLRSRPAPLTADHRQRRVDIANRLKNGVFLNVCEVVRDLTARGWTKPLGEQDALALRKAREVLCEEWAVATGRPVSEAYQEVEALLLEGRQAHAG